VFVDKRTQSKVMLLSGDGKSVPAELAELIDPATMPLCCGGSSEEPVLDLRSTL
jgi:hypothetical protein